MIRVENLYKSYNSNIILEHVSIIIKEGEIAILYGKNGVGKTTLIKCILGLINYHKGKINLSSSNKVGVVLNNEMLIKKLTVFEYLKFVCLLKEMKSEDFYFKIKKLINYFDLENDKNKLVEELSNGTKSKIKLIASIIFDPLIMILDEPFSGMDIVTIEKSVKLINKKASEGCSILISSHNINIVKTIQADLLILKDKTIKQKITHKEINNLENLNTFLLNVI